MSTPMMKQYFEQKEQYKDTLLFFRMGDFFELFYDDAVKAAKVLDIALTRRGKAGDGNEIPMCGVPAHSYEAYLLKLIANGFKVAICDQLESPEEAKKRGYKEIVRREVVRVVTPGTLTEESLLPAQKPNFLAAFGVSGKEFAVAWVDISTGKFNVQNLSASQIPAELARINPSELVLPEQIFYNEELSKSFADFKMRLTPQPNNVFEATRAEKALKGFYKVISLDGFGKLTKQQISAAGALIEYLQLTQNQNGFALQFPQVYSTSSHMQIDAGARKSLELTEGECSLFRAINKTKTSAGARWLYSAISSPLAYAEGVNARLDAVEFLVNETAICTRITEILAATPDLERSFTRVAYGRGDVRDMLCIKTALVSAVELKNALLAANTLPAYITAALQNLRPLSNIINLVMDAFKDTPSLSIKEGNFIREGYNAELDNLINIRDHSRRLIDELKSRYAEETGVPNLKINYNNMLGYFIEVSPQNAKKLPETFILRQSMANAMRFSTPELNDIQSKALTAADKARQIELQIFAETASEITQCAENILLTAESIAVVDFLQSLATLASEHKYVKPVVDDSAAFEIESGRHPVVELTTSFTPNSCNLTSRSLWLLTGPNMAGKSTFLRQNVLIAVLAQIGSFVPATSAHIGCADKIFSRVGASDNLARGQSTFMVEMTETAAILNEATAKSLVILDEIGRGTATYDGLSIAWAVLEHIHNKIKCRTIFATHYHELTQLKLPMIALYSMKVREWKEEIIFLHEVAEGAANRSYGIHVGKLAGLPPKVTQRAEEILKSLESPLSDQMPLFAAAPAPAAKPEPEAQDSELKAMLNDIDPNSLTPREALDILFKLKEKV